MRQPSVFVCELRPHEGVQLKRIARTAKQFARRQRAQILLASASGMSAPQIAAVVRTDENQVRRVIHEFNMLGMDSLRPRAGGGRPLTIDQPTRDRVVAIALACPCVHGEPLNRWSLRRLRRYLLRRRILGHISVEGLRQLLRRAGASWQRTRTWKTSPDPDYEAKASRILRLYRAAEGGRAARHGCVVVCLDECGPLSLRPWPGSAWAPRKRPWRTRATYRRPHGVRYLLGCYDVGADRLQGRLVEHKDGPTTLAALKRIRARYPNQVGVLVVLDNLSAHFTPRSAPGLGPTGCGWCRPRPTPATSTGSSVTSGPSWSSSSAARTTPATTSSPRRPVGISGIATVLIAMHASESLKTGARLPDTPLAELGVVKTLPSLS